MKRFCKNIILVVLLVSLMTLWVNELYVKLYHANEDYTDKFHTIPAQIQICNFGSSHGLYGFNYEDYSKQYVCFNFGLVSQYLSYDDRLFQEYENYVSENAIVFITVSYFELFGKGEQYDADFESKNRRYYSILPKSLVKEYDYKTDFFVQHLPALCASTGGLLKTLLGQSKVDALEADWTRLSSDICVSEDAKAACERHIGTSRCDENGERIINKEEIDALYHIINACKVKGAIPILITTPYLKEYTDEMAKVDGFYEQFYSIIDQVIADTGVQYYDYAFDERFNNRYEWFMNADHLNKEGARNFVSILMDEIVKEKAEFLR